MMDFQSNTQYILLTIIAVIILTAFAIHVVRFFKLNSLQKKRDECDLTTARGRSLANEYNNKINRLMNYAERE